MWIRIKVQEEYSEVSIKDNGVGMTAEELEQLFIQKESSTDRIKVGLRNINRRLKQLYNQELMFESAPNQGTTVSFQIPRKE